MKPLRFALLLALPLSLLSCSLPAARAQSPAPRSRAQSSFEQIKSLAGTCEGTLTIDPAAASYRGKHLQVRMRVASAWSDGAHAA